MSEIDGLARKTVFSISPYIPGKPIEEVKREYGITDVIKMASNENPLGPSPLALQALKDAIDKVNIYPDGNCYYLKQELAANLGCAEDQLIIGNGSDEVLKLLAETFLNPGDEVIFAQPTFSEYEFVCRVMDAVPVGVPVASDFGHDLQAMADRINNRTKIIFICNPNNPTGNIITGDDLDAFLNKVPEHMLVVMDEAYHEYVTDPAYPDSLAYVKKGSRLISLRTFAKIYGLAGLRIGYGVSSPEIIALINRVKEPFNVNCLAQIAARAALHDFEHLRRSRELVASGISFLYEAFDRIGLKYVRTQANFIFVDIGVDSRKIFPILLKEGIIVRTGDIFGLPNYIRVTIGTADQNLRFVQTIERILKFV
ncbi:MAG: histidinol-phosphate transaminase [Thermacetogeniaceae bacterium]